MRLHDETSSVRDRNKIYLQISLLDVSSSTAVHPHGRAPIFVKANDGWHLLRSGSQIISSDGKNALKVNTSRLHA